MLERVHAGLGADPRAGQQPGVRGDPGPAPVRGLDRRPHLAAVNGEVSRSGPSR